MRFDLAEAEERAQKLLAELDKELRADDGYFACPGCSSRTSGKAAWVSQLVKSHECPRVLDARAVVALAALYREARQENERLKREAQAAPVDPHAWWELSDKETRLRDELAQIHAGHLPCHGPEDCPAALYREAVEALKKTLGEINAVRDELGTQYPALAEAAMLAAAVLAEAREAGALPKEGR